MVLSLMWSLNSVIEISILIENLHFLPNSWCKFFFLIDLSWFMFYCDVTFGLLQGNYVRILTIGYCKVGKIKLILNMVYWSNTNRWLVSAVGDVLLMSFAFSLIIFSKRCFQSILRINLDHVWYLKSFFRNSNHATHWSSLISYRCDKHVASPLGTHPTNPHYKSLDE